jgi:hypothetical protein
MASPHVAGIMALLLEQHPAWSVAELKALAMNTATNDVYSGLNHTGNKYSPSRIGAGRASVANAVQSDVIAYYKNDPGQVSVAFGQVELVTTQTFVKSITIANKGAAALEYTAAFESRYQANPGLTFLLLDASNVGLDHPVTIPAGGTLEIKVQVTVNPTLLTRSLDPTLATGSRQRFSEGGGYVTLTPTAAAPSLRVPVHIAARPAAAMSVLENSIDLPADATGTFDLTLTGTPVDLTTESSRAYILELMGEDPNEPTSSGLVNAADLQYVGVTMDPVSTYADSAVFFGVSTYGRWDTSQSVEFDIYLDIDEDGLSDYVVFNVTYGFFTGTTDDVMFAAICPVAGGSATIDYCDYWNYINLYSGSTNTNLFHNNVMVLPVPFFAVELAEGNNTDFDFQVVTFSRDGSGAIDESEVYSYDASAAAQSFDTVDPVYSVAPVWYDIADAQPTFTIGYDKANIAANDSKGLLILRPHNAVNTAEVVLMDEYVSLYSSKNPLWGTSLAPVQTTLTLENQTATSCSFNLSISGNTWQAALSAPNKFVPAGASDTVDLTVLIPATATYGDADTFTVSATCSTDSAIQDLYEITVNMEAVIYLPVIGR